jgi:hypothetical protein
MAPQEPLKPPPILLATRALGWADSTTAALLGIPQPRVAEWAATGRIPPVRHLALILLVIRLCEGLLDQQHADPYEHRRTLIMGQAANAYATLAKKILDRDFGAEIPPDLIERAYMVHDQAVDRIRHVESIRAKISQIDSRIAEIDAEIADKRAAIAGLEWRQRRSKRVLITS